MPVKIYLVNSSWDISLEANQGKRVASPASALSTASTQPQLTAASFSSSSVRNPVNHTSSFPGFGLLTVEDPILAVNLTQETPMFLNHLAATVLWVSQECRQEMMDFS